MCDSSAVFTAGRVTFQSQEATELLILESCRTGGMPHPQECLALTNGFRRGWAEVCGVWQKFLSHFARLASSVPKRNESRSCPAGI
jgi:hypothetical protein